MELRRFFLDKSAFSGSNVIIDGEEFIHLVKVLRHKVGYLLIACEGSGKEYLCKIIEIKEKEAICEITDVMDNNTEPKIDITLCLGLIKNEKMTIAIQKAVELGANRIILYKSRYTSEQKANIERYRKVAKESAKQCGRAVLPEVIGVVSFEQAIRNDSSAKLIAYEKENINTLLSVTQDVSNKIVVVIGSEGGFCEKEIELAKSNGYTSFSLGRRILRAETAAIVTLGYLTQVLDS